MHFHKIRNAFHVKFINDFFVSIYCWFRVSEISQLLVSELLVSEIVFHILYTTIQPSQSSDTHFFHFASKKWPKNCMWKQIDSRHQLLYKNFWHFKDSDTHIRTSGCLKFWYGCQNLWSVRNSYMNFLVCLFSHTILKPFFLAKWQKWVSELWGVRSFGCQNFCLPPRHLPKKTQ